MNSADRDLGSTSRATRMVLIAILVIGTLIVIGFEGRKAYYDYEVRVLCEADGGMKVYQTVPLQADQFDKWGLSSSTVAHQEKMH